MAILFCWFLVQNKGRIASHTLTFFMLPLFIGSMLWSAAWQTNIEPVVVGASISVSILAIFLLSKYVPTGDRFEGYILLLPSVLVLCLSLALEPPKLIKYSGVFTNPNALGRCVAFGALLACITSIRNFRSKEDTSFGIFCAISLFSIAATTFSRTSLGCLVISIGVGFLAVTAWILSKVATNFTVARWWVSSTLVTGVLVYAIILISGPLLFELFFAKSLIKLGNDDLTSGRLELWKAAYKEVHWFGNISAARALEDPHSTYINFSLKYGFIPAAIFFGSLLAVATRAFVIVVAGNFKFLPELMCFVFLLSYWAFETALGVPILWVSLYFYYVRSTRGR